MKTSRLIPVFAFLIAICAAFTTSFSKETVSNEDIFWYLDPDDGCQPCQQGIMESPEECEPVEQGIICECLEPNDEARTAPSDGCRVLKRPSR